MTMISIDEIYNIRKKEYIETVITFFFMRIEVL